jgi:hypothetical protein
MLPRTFITACAVKAHLVDRNVSSKLTPKAQSNERECSLIMYM